MLKDCFIFVSMMIELQCRFQSTKGLDKETEEKISEELYNLSIIKGEKFNEEDEREKLLAEYNVSSSMYAPFTLDLSSVMAFNRVDDEHTCLRFFEGMAYTFRIKYEIFREVFIALSGRVINDFSNILIKENDSRQSKRHEND